MVFVMVVLFAPHFKAWVQASRHVLPHRFPLPQVHFMAGLRGVPLLHFCLLPLSAIVPFRTFPVPTFLLLLYEPLSVSRSWVGYTLCWKPVQSFYAINSLYSCHFFTRRFATSFDWIFQILSLNEYFRFCLWSSIWLNWANKIALGWMFSTLKGEGSGGLWMTARHHFEIGALLHLCLWTGNKGASK